MMRAPIPAAPGAQPISPSRQFLRNVMAPAMVQCREEACGSAPRKACPRAYKKLDGVRPAFGQAAAQKLFADRGTGAAGSRIRDNQMILVEAEIRRIGNHPVNPFDRDMTFSDRDVAPDRSICGRHPRINRPSTACPQHIHRPSMADSRARARYLLRTNPQGGQFSRRPDRTRNGTPR